MTSNVPDTLKCHNHYTLQRSGNNLVCLTLLYSIQALQLKVRLQQQVHDKALGHNTIQL